MELKQSVIKEYVIKVNGMFVSDVGTSEISFTGNALNAKRFSDDAVSLGRLIRSTHAMVRLGMDGSQIEIMEVETTVLLNNRIVDVEAIKMANGFVHGKVIEKEVK